MLFFSFSSVSRLRLLSSLLHPKRKIKTPVSDCGECEHTFIWYMLKHKRASNEVEDEKQNRTERFKCERKDVEEVCGFIIVCYVGVGAEHVDEMEWSEWTDHHRVYFHYVFASSTASCTAQTGNPMIPPTNTKWYLHSHDYEFNFEQSSN